MPSLFGLCAICIVALSFGSSANFIEPSNKLVEDRINEPSCVSSEFSIKDIVQDSKSNESKRFVVELRRSFHRIPELKYEEFKTSQLIRETLTRLDVNFTDNLAGGTGIVATLGQGTPVVALRADMDALPMEEHEEVGTGAKLDREEGEEVFRSLHPGRMHACGHDAHTAMLLGVARVLRRHQSSLRGTVMLVFQPAEEGGAGAKRMLADFPALGLVNVMFGLHVAPWLPFGTLHSRPGTIMAASTNFKVHLVGVGGHAGFPHRLRDPVLAAAACVQALQSLVSREADPSSEGVVVSVTSMFTPPGAALNVMPDDVHFGGTIRALTPTAFDRTQRRVYEVIKSTAEIYGCVAAVDSGGRVPYPPVLNNANAFDMGMDVAKKVFPSTHVQLMDAPIMAAEDFAFYSQVVPSAYFMLGQGNETLKTDVGLHNRRFQIQEDILAEGVSFQTSLVALSFDLLASGEF